jgi:alpha-maltose-1-phosphate synthase
VVATHEPWMVGVGYGAPFDPLTKSGTSYHFFMALQRRGVLAGVVSVRPVVFDYIEKAISFHPDRETWRQRYHASSYPLAPAIRLSMSQVGGYRAAKLNASPEALLQVSTWIDMSASRKLKPRLRCCYNDANVGAWLTRPDLVLDRSSRSVRRTLEFERRVFDSMDLIFTMSEWARQSFIEEYEQDAAKVVVASSGPNLDPVPEPPGEREFDVPRFLFVGKSFNRKGGSLLLEAFERVRHVRPKAELWIVGPSRLPRMPPGVRSFGFIGRQTPEGAARIDRIYRDATAFVLPTRYEGFGIPILEAMGYQLPCIGTRCCAIPEMIEDGESGFLVARDDADQLAERMISLADDPERSMRMGEAGRRRLLARFTWDRVAERIDAEVSKALGRA